MKDGKTVAVIPGSFDPITLGHIELVRYAAKNYDTVFLAVMINPAKSYMLSIDERVSVARAAVSDIDNVSVVSSVGMLWELCRDLCADAIVKGYRNDGDYAYEMDMASFNEAHYPQAKTVLLRSVPELEGVSSTLLRERLARGETIDGLLPPSAADVFNRIIKSHKIQ